MTVTQLVRRERSRVATLLAMRGAAVALALAAVVAAAASVALGEARWITRPALPALAWVLAGALAALAGWWTWRAVRRQASDVRVAAEIERERALRAGSLRGALEVADSGPLGRRAAELLAQRLRAQRGALAPALQRRGWRRGLVAAAGAAAAVAALAAARGVSPDGWRAMRHPVRAFTGELLGPIRFMDTPRAVLRGERLRVEIAAPERRRLTLALRTTGRPWRAESLAVQGGVAWTVIGPLDADVALVASDGRSGTDTLLVRVTDRPFVGDVAIRAEYPAYLGRAAEVVPVGEKLRLPQGTVLRVRGRASTALRGVGLARGADTLRLDADGHTFGGSLTAQTGVWTWWGAAAQGPIADVPAPMEIEVVPDSAPRVEILSPASDTVVLAGTEVALQLAATDDHGLSSVSLRSWRRAATGGAQPTVTQAAGTPEGAQWTGGQTLDLAARELEPGDELHVVATATDASPWRLTGSSRELVLRVPSMEQRREMARDLADSAAAHAAAAAKAQGQLEQRTGDASRSRGQRQEAGNGGAAENGDRAGREAMSYEQAERTKALAQQQDEVKAQVEKLRQEARQLEQQLRAAGALDSSLQRQLRDVQKMLAEALTPELSAQLQQLQSASKMSPDEARRSLQQLAEMQKRLREQLERSAEMLKRAALEGAMQTLRDDAKELAQEERSFADSLARGDQASRERGAELSERSSELSDEIQELAKRLQKEKAESGPAKLEQASRDAGESADAMRRAAQAQRPESPVTKEGAKSGARADERRQAGDEKAGEQKAGEQKAGEQKADERTAGEQKAGEKQSGEQRSGEQQSGEQRSGEQQSGAREGQQQGQQQGSGARGAQAAREGADEMERAAQQLAEARENQIAEWKQELTGELDKSIQETLQLAREQQALAEKARAGETPQSLRGEQSAVQQGAERVGERLQREAGKSAHVSSQSQGAVGEARRKVQQATEQVAEANRGQQSAEAMDDAAQALNRAAASLVRDRDRVANAQSASGFAEMLQRMQEAAKQQGQINAQAAGLLPMPGAESGNQARALGGKQRALARQLEQAGEQDASGRADEMAKEMRQIAAQLEQGRVDQSVVDRQQRLFRRLLDAGLSLEKEEREDKGERESVAASGSELLTPAGEGRGKDALRWREPNWSELRGLSAEERRAVLEYFKRINAEPARP